MTLYWTKVKILDALIGGFWHREAEGGQQDILVINLGLKNQRK